MRNDSMQGFTIGRKGKIEKCYGKDSNISQCRFLTVSSVGLAFMTFYLSCFLDGFALAFHCPSSTLINIKETGCKDIVFSRTNIFRCHRYISKLKKINLTSKYSPGRLALKVWNSDLTSAPTSSITSSMNSLLSNLDPSNLINTKSLGVDYGTKKVGLSISYGYSPRPLGSFYHGEDIDLACDEILKAAVKESVDRIVLGLPLFKDGSMSPQGHLTREFAQLLVDKIYLMATRDNSKDIFDWIDDHSLEFFKNLAMNVEEHKLGETHEMSSLSVELERKSLKDFIYLWDERYSSQFAKTLIKNKEFNGIVMDTDSHAACLILEDFYENEGQLSSKSAEIVSPNLENIEKMIRERQIIENALSSSEDSNDSKDVAQEKSKNHSIKVSNADDELSKRKTYKEIREEMISNMNKTKNKKS